MKSLEIDGTTEIGITYRTIAAAVAAHVEDHAIGSVTVNIHAPTFLVGQPARDGRDPTWVVTGRTERIEVAGEKVTAIEYVDIDTIEMPMPEGAVRHRPLALLKHVKPERVAAMVALWLDEFGNDNVRRIYVDCEGTIRRSA